MPATISMEEEIALAKLAELLRQPARYGCRFDCPPPEEDHAGARQIVDEALEVIEDLYAQRLRRRRDMV